MLLSIATTTGLALLLYLSGIFAIFTPLPLILQFLKRGARPVAVSFASAMLGLFFLYRAQTTPLFFLPLVTLYPHLTLFQITVLSLLYFFYFGWTALSIAMATRYRFSMEKSVLGILLSAVLIPGVLFVGILKGTGHPVFSEIGGVFQWLMGQMIQIQGQSGNGGGEELEFLKQHGPGIVSQAIRLIPALWVNFTLVMISLNLLFLRRLIPLNRPFSHWTGFSLWRLAEKWIWFPIAMGVLYFLNFYMMKSPSLEIALTNLLIVLAMVYFLQGLAIVLFFFQRFSPLLRLMAYLAIIFFVQVMGIFIAILGVFDFWFDFRKVKKIV